MNRQFCYNKDGLCEDDHCRCNDVEETNVTNNLLSEVWVIWSFEHEGWWKPNGNGYTQDFTEAGKYTFDQADEIIIHANSHGQRNEAMLPYSFAKEMYGSRK